MHKLIVKKSRLDDGWVWYCTGCSQWRHRASWRNAYKSALFHAIWSRRHPYLHGLC